MAKIDKIKVKFHFAWWFNWLYLPAFMMIIFIIRAYINVNFEPNYDRFNYWVSKATVLHKPK